MNRPDGETPAALGNATGEGANPQPDRTLPAPDAAEPIQSQTGIRLVAGTDARPRQPVASLGDLPMVGAWLREARLEPVNFKFARRHELVDGYPKQVAAARFTADAIEVFGDVTALSVERQRELLAEIKASDLPTQVTLTAISTPPPGCNPDDKDSFVCHDFNGQIVMVLQRFDLENGDKAFKSWTRFSDGQWRNMEPDVLPFFGVPGYQHASTLYIHEGAKGVERAKAFFDGLLPNDRFPWLEDMRWGHHVAWLGGVHSLDRSDWDRLAKAGWDRVVIVADNDGAGIKVVPGIACHFRCKTDVVRFGGHFPPRFDLGDPWPKEHFDAQGRYTGPTFADCCQPAEWATDLVTMLVNGRTRDVPVLRPNFISRNRVVTDTAQVFQADRPAVAMSKERANDEFRWRSDARDTYSELIRHPEAVCSRRVYNPSKPAGPIIHNEELCWNAFQKARVAPVQGDPKPFLDFVEHLLPLPADRAAFLRWLATLIARRDVKMRYSLLMISKQQGVGKSTVGSILKRLLGSHNVSFPGERSIADSQFNSWALGKLLIFVNEIYSDGKATVYDKLKPYVTDDDIEINEKGIKAVQQDNWAVIVACSNSDKALYIPDDDRRWFIPTITGNLKPPEFWNDLNAWLDADGIAIILRWAQDFVKTDWVKTGERPPESTAKAAIIASSKSEGRLLALDFAQDFAALPPAVVTATSIRKWVAGRRGIGLDDRRLEREATLLDELASVPGLVIWKGDQRPKIGGRNGFKASVVFNFTPDKGATWSAVEKHYTTLDKIGFENAF